MGFIRKLISDNNDVNEKIIVGFVSFVMMLLFATISVTGSILGHNIHIDETIYQSFVFITIGTFGISGMQTIFTNRSQSNQGCDEIEE